MKRFLSLIIPIFLIGLGISFYYAYDPIQAGVRKIVYNIRYNAKLNDGLVGYWSFNGADVANSLTASSTATDFGSGGNNAQIKLGMKRLPGIAGQALEFNGTDEWVYVKNSAVVTETGNFTISAWINPHNIAALQWIFSQNNSSDSDQLWGFFISNGKLRYNIRDINDLNEIDRTANTTLSANTWNHIVFTYDTTNKFTFYVNGISDGTGADTIAGTYNTNNVNIGGMLRSTPNYDMEGLFDGLIDEVRLYNRALSAAEVAYLFTRDNPEQRSKTSALNKTNAANGLVGYWSFNDEDVEGITATDRSTGGNNGTLNGGPAVTPGVIGQALLFDNVDDFVNIAAATNLNFGSGNFTISAWVLPLSQERFIVMDNGDSSIMIAPNEAYVRDSGADLVNPADTYPALGFWYYVTLVRSGTTVTLYRNGVSVAEGTNASLGTIDANDHWHIGLAGVSGVDTHSNFFNGALDEVRIYNRAISAAEIKNLYEEKRRKFINMPQNKMVNDGLVGFWTFNGPDVAGITATDRSTGGNNGTLNGGPAVTPGVIGQALNFDGTDDAVGLPDLSEIEDKVISVSAWFSISTAPTGAATIYGEGLTTDFAPAYQIWVNTDASIRLYFQADAGGGGPVLISGTTYADGRWHHLAVVTASATSHAMYIDGVQVATASTNLGAITVNASDIGAIRNGSVNRSQFFNGKLDEVRIYNRALSTAEIAELYNAGRRE